jgi:hypothetical protein
VLTDAPTSAAVPHRSAHQSTALQPVNQPAEVAHRTSGGTLGSEGSQDGLAFKQSRSTQALKDVVGSLLAELVANTVVLIEV